MTWPSWGCPRAVSNRRVGEQLAGVGGRWESLGKKDGVNSRGRNLKDWRVNEKKKKD